ncbi:MAG: hypothetical protein ACU83N_15130 [Gammaproteobacteria bacterium]
MALLHEFGLSVLRYSPVLDALRGQPGVAGWGEKLIELTRPKKTAPLRQYPTHT